MGGALLCVWEGLLYPKLGVGAVLLPRKCFVGGQKARGEVLKGIWGQIAPL